MNDCELRSTGRVRWTWRSVPDRTAVLVAGLIAGFVVGTSFHDEQARAPTPAAAVDTPPPHRTALGSEPVDPRVANRVRASEGLVRVGVFGDSFGVGVWYGLDAQLSRAEGYDVLRFGKEATGFTRYNALNLERRASEQLARSPIDVAVICFGANDAIPFYADGALQSFMSPGWRRIVGERIDRFVAVARSTGASVYWLGLPAMREARLDADTQALNALYADHMRRLGVPFVDTRALSVDAKGRYSSHLPDANGSLRLMRTPDGLHMIGIGYQRITAQVAAGIARYARAARAGPYAAPVEDRRR